MNYAIVVLTAVLIYILIRTMLKKEKLETLSVFGISAPATVHDAGVSLRLLPDQTTDADKRLIGKGRARLLMSHGSTLVVFYASKSMIDLYNVNRDEFYDVFIVLLSISDLDIFIPLAKRQDLFLSAWVEGSD